VGKTLLLGSFGASLALTLWDDDDLETPFARLAAGVLMLAFFTGLLNCLWSLGGELTQLMERLGPKEGLTDFILSSLVKAGTIFPARQPRDWQEFLPNAINNVKSVVGNPISLTNQIVRFGVWGVVASIADFLFVLVGFILEVARDVLWQLLLILFPLACGVFPLFPAILKNFVVYAVEVTLWFPLLQLIQSATSLVARQYVVLPESIGLYVVAVEIVAVALILLIPSLAHRMVHGALSADLGASGSVTGHVRRAFGALI
jgi:hypothetical protein